MNRLTGLLVAASLAFGIALTVSACGGDDESGEPTTTTQATEATEGSQPADGAAAGSGAQEKPAAGGGNTSTVDLSKPGEVKKLCKQIPDACTFYPNE